jgi:hypothetical protein
MKFRLNLIREFQARQAARESARNRVLWLNTVCFGLLAAALLYGTFQTVRMRSMVAEERTRLAHVKAEYQHYKASEMIVSKADVELLDRLQNNRIFWTKKLLAMARYLPENYWITQFDYDLQYFTVKGYGYITDRQEQLLTLHSYLDALRKEPSFNDEFKSVYLNSTVRTDEANSRERASFSYSCTKGNQP